jgi:hypothetical protein
VTFTGTPAALSSGTAGSKLTPSRDTTGTLTTTLGASVNNS